MSDNQFWLGLWALAASVLMVLISAIAMYNISANNTVVTLTKAGADPVGAACAINGRGCAPYYIAVAAERGAK